MTTVDFKKAVSMYGFMELDTNGNQVVMDTYKGKVCLIVNISARDPLSEKMFKQLTTIFRKYKNSQSKHEASPAKGSPEKVTGVTDGAHFGLEFFQAIPQLGISFWQIAKSPTPSMSKSIDLIGVLVGLIHKAELCQNFHKFRPY
jgi:Glutathione peroxidase